MATLEAHDLRYAVRGTILLDAVSFAARAGCVTAIVGPNGAGKTTLLRALAGTLAVEGRLSIDGACTSTMTRRVLARRVAFVAADDTTDRDLLLEEIVTEGRYAHRRGAFDRSPEHDRIVERALESVGLTAFRGRRYAELSSGERRRVWIALGLAQEADVLLLDEPTANLDIRHAQQILRLVRTLADDGKAVAIVLHDFNEAAQFADEIALMERGRLVALGTPRDVLTADRIARCYGVRVEIVTAADGKMRVFPRA